MQKLFKECLPWLNWQGVVVLGGVLAGMLFYVERSSWGAWMGATPLLALAVCLLSCLVPLAFLWRKRNDQDSVQTK